MNKSSDSERKTISERIQDLKLKHLQEGISTGSKVICHNCGHAKPLLGSVHYDQYRLCNDCALRYELAKAEGHVQTIEDFVLAE